MELRRTVREGRINNWHKVKGKRSKLRLEKKARGSKWHQGERV